MDNTVFQKRLKQFLVLLVVLIVLSIAWSIYYASTFRIVSTNPNSKNITTVTPFFKINFSKAVSADSLSVSASPSIITSSALSNADKTLTLNLAIPLNKNTKYTITVVSVSDTAGKLLTDIKFVFSPAYVDYANLPSDQQTAILQQQAADAANQPPAYAGTNALINSGVSVQQIQDFEQAITSFAQSQKIDLHSTIINQSSLSTAPLNPNTGAFAIDFKVSINGTTFGAKLQYSGITSAELFLYSNPQGSQVFDSGDITFSTSGT